MQQIVLVDENDGEIGVMEKMEAHQKGILHRAFSVFIFNSQGEMLLQQRSLDKYHSGGLWTNTCCSHPAPGEAVLAAAERRLLEEMGFSTALSKVFDFIYRIPLDKGLTEYEFDHVLTGMYDGEVMPNPAEVADFRFFRPEEIKEALITDPGAYTEWFKIAFARLII